MNQSIELFERAKKIIPGGVNSPVRAFRSVLARAALALVHIQITVPRQRRTRTALHHSALGLVLTDVRVATHAVSEAHHARTPVCMHSTTEALCAGAARAWSSPFAARTHAPTRPSQALQRK